MRPVVTAAQMAAADKAAIEDLQIGQIRLMELAGARAAEIVRGKFGAGRLDGCSFLIVCGRGNNGGDGFVLARHLLNSGANVDLVLLYPRSELSDLNRNALEILDAYQTRTDKLRLFGSVAEALPSATDTTYDALVDAVLGTGLNIVGALHPLRPPASEGIELLSSISAAHSGTPLFALDVPSGLDATTGMSAMPAVTADITIAMAFSKTGFFFNDGPKRCGDIRTAEISIPEYLLDRSICRLTDREFASKQFILRDPMGAKHMNGKVLVIAGSHSGHSSMLGAAMLSVKAALKTGAGYVCAAIPTAGAGALNTVAPEAVVIGREMDGVLERVAWADTTLIGCGMGRQPDTVEWIRKLLRNPVLTGKKLVLDADALYAVAGTTILQDHLEGENTILTPHYGEFSLLSGIAPENVGEHPLACAAEFSQRNKVCLLLKGRPSVLADSAGTLMINDTGTEALSTAGSGDILAGMIAALASKGAGMLEAGAAAAWFHGRAGDLADEVSSLVSAEDILRAIPAAIHESFDPEK